MHWSCTEPANALCIHMTVCGVSGQYFSGYSVKNILFILFSWTSLLLFPWGACALYISVIWSVTIIFIILWNFPRWLSHLSPLQTEQSQVFYSFDLVLNTGQWENLMANLGGKDIRMPKRSWERKGFRKILTYFPELGFFSDLGEEECFVTNHPKVRFFLTFIGHLQNFLIL